MESEEAPLPPGERWGTVVGLGGLYEVSDRGTVRDRTTGVEIPSYWAAVKGGGWIVIMRDPAGKMTTRRLARLMVEAFFGPRDLTWFPDFKDGDPSHCTLDNLYWTKRNEYAKRREREPWIAELAVEVNRRLVDRKKRGVQAASGGDAIPPANQQADVDGDRSVGAVSPCGLPAPASPRPPGQAPRRWTDIPGCEGLYQVHPDGRLRKVVGVRTVSLQPSGGTTNGYFSLILPDGRRLRRPAAEIIAEIFLGPRSPGHHIAYRDGNPENVTADNLQYVSVAADQIGNPASVDEERWRAVIGFQSDLEVSDRGNLRHRRTKAPKATIFEAKHPRKPMVTLRRRMPDGKVTSTRASLARLVLDAFGPPPPPGHCPGHVDGNPSNCVLNNLEWVPKAVRMRQVPVRPDDRRRVPPEKAEKARGLLAAGQAVAAVAQAVGVSEHFLYHLDGGAAVAAGRARTVSDTDEIWKPLFDLYEASSQGRVRNARTGALCTGRVRSAKGLVTYSLETDSGRSSVSAATAVAIAFHGDRSSEGMAIRPRDGNWSNLTPDNLHWVAKEIKDDEGEARDAA